eukprot:jgi/Undpi1/1988/HiC_scaffold_12.g05375.m1
MLLGISSTPAEITKLPTCPELFSCLSCACLTLFAPLRQIYQECGRLFFHVYDPEFCTSSFCDIEEWQISPLLAPALDQPPEFGPSTVPRDRQDLFARLVGLLSFETHPQDTVEKQRLTCKRRLRRLLRDTRYLDGHLAQLVVYEEAKGELRCSVYLAHHSARIQLKVNAKFLERVLQDCGDGTRERQAIESEDSDRLLVPITDRLEISPSRTVVATMGVGHGASRKKTPSQGFSLKLRCKEEPIGRSTYVNDFIGGTAPVCLPRQGECKIFARAVSIRKDDWESHQPVCDTVVTVFASSPSGAGDGGADKDDGVCLRAVVYYTKMAAYAEVTIKDFIDLRQVVGALHQPLAHEWRHQGHNDGTAAEALFYFIFRHRAIVALGVWDDSIGAYVEHGAGFTIVLKRSRLYSSVKQTPIHLRGEQDAQANIGHLIDDASRRGTKVFRRAVNVSTTLFQITVYELPPPEDSREIAPTLKFIAYDSKTRKQLIAVVCPDAVLELGGGESSPWMAQEKRETLAGILVQALRLKISQDGSPTLMMPWSGENLVFLDEALPGETSRPRRDKARACAKREGLSRLDVFSTRVTGFEVVITVFVETDQSLPVPATKVEDEDADQPTLIFNLYCPKLSKSADVDLPHAMQKIMTGKNILHFPTGMARSTAIRRTTRFLCINQPTTSKQLHAEFILKENKPWLVAYNELDPSDRPSAQRPHGQPLIFIPGDTVGDPITSEGIDISGLKVLLSVYSKDKGRPGREGLVWEVYNQETCARCILHLSSSRLLEQVDNKDYLCEDSRLVETIHALTKRLVLKKAATGGWDLRLDRTIKPWMFCGL